jgi:Na+-translocating ferredoxin:NAD+ oxidoreductase RNF subunit RnfB
MLFDPQGWPFSKKSNSKGGVMNGKSNVFDDLRQHIDQFMPVGFPSTKSGVEINILKRLFSPEEAELAMKLGPVPETVAEIFPRLKESGITIEELEKRLDSMAMKALIMGGKLAAGGKGEKRYSLAQWAIGIYEFQVDRLSKELAKDAKDYMNEAFYKEWFKPDTPPQMRTIPVARSLGVEHHVSTYDDVRSLLENAEGPFSIHNCVCKQNMELLGKPCEVTADARTCNTFGKMAEVFIDAGLGREVTREEILEALENYEKKGLVLQPENSQSPGFICACCGCCCGVLQMMKNFPRPAELYTSNYFAVVNRELCEGCETCINRCQMEALAIESDVSTVNLDRCIGCGLCVSTCPAGAIQLQKKERAITPPKDSGELYQTIMVKKLGAAK